MSIQLLFSTDALPVSWVIRAFTWSTWSHVALVDGDHVIESMPGCGVRRVPLADALRDTGRHELVTMPTNRQVQVLSAAASQIGRPYDYGAVLGIGLHRDWQQDDAWFCSELIAWAFQQAGEPLYRAECMRRVTPQHLYMLPVLPEVMFS
ncbi:YiiX/YebB-like N1pC/P60 family cysteine hydrolase [Burkholderia cepacia]|uniref:YiiX/YebB-like N1pC/P60 family cysteine hydrolase n=1 Tax=Burkholderia cepacia TaxID=292 RepID=UPI0026E0E9C0|nr:YiiX/YebB-like N1pC/P60 family cysteine hydrolase [Burkholderia cepacia]MDO5940654.1 YiiX/YebB-like N1pC/P60 family cysteine hydrolase [Burkholderia cepacia]